MKPLALATALGSLLLLYGSEGQDRIGVAAPPLALRSWLHSPPLEMKDLRGKVVLVRWWTDGCSLCSATAPALRRLQQKYGERGLVIVGVFHPKPAGDWSVERARRGAQRLGFTFPVAVDGDWKALHRWWLDQGSRGFTSVSFVVDKAGVIRYVQPGGEFHEGDAGDPAASHQACQTQYKEIDQIIARLLREP